MTYSKIRKQCVICKSEDLSVLFTLNLMPVFMGANKGDFSLYENMTFQKCNECLNVQIKEVVDSNLLYMNNHNLEVVGDTWKSHYIELCKFIEPHVINKTIMEIGDPSYKISSVISDITKEWYIIEINPNEQITKPEKVIINKSFFDDKFVLDKNIDVVIHSHLLEHITNPVEHLKQINNVLSENGMLIFSIPNLSKILHDGGSPNSVLHFEHTYFYDKSFMEKILNNAGFEVLEVKEFKKHSLFFKCVKNNSVKTLIKHDVGSAELFLVNYGMFKDKVNNINKAIETAETVYLYGCHISSQFMINVGLNIDKIKFIIDNSTSKEGYPLYGTNIITKNPHIISNDDKPTVILSHMGIYSDEILKQLIEINKNVIVL